MDFVSFLILLVIIMDPIGLAPMMQSFLRNYSPRERRRILFRELFFAMMILLCFMAFGNVLMKFLQLNQSTLNISGGVLLFIVALGMVFPALSVMRSDKESGASKKDEPFIVPIATPFIAGPAAIAIVMLYAAKASGPTERLILGGAVVGACLIAAVVLLASQYFLKFLGDKMTIALERLMGMLLILISIQMFMNGLHSYDGRKQGMEEPTVSEHSQP